MKMRTSEGSPLAMFTLLRGAPASGTIGNGFSGSDGPIDSCSEQTRLLDFNLNMWSEIDTKTTHWTAYILGHSATHVEEICKVWVLLLLWSQGLVPGGHPKTPRRPEATAVQSPGRHRCRREWRPGRAMSRAGIGSWFAFG